MKSGTVLVTGSSGLIGSETVELFNRLGYVVHGIDNNSRQCFFGPDGDTTWNLERLRRECSSYIHHHVDIRSQGKLDRLVKEVRPDFVVHCAAQPAHDYARQYPVVDFHINVLGTANLLEACREHVPESPFVFCSSSKVYGPVNDIPYQESATRYDIRAHGDSPGVSNQGINENFPLSGGNGRGIYGSGKAAADLMVQEYGETYGVPTVCLRGNCMTGSGHSPAELHGFLAYLAKCLMQGRTYHIFGYKGKQVRDIIHASDFANAILMACLAPPQPGTVYNLGGGRPNSVSILEAADMLETLSGMRLKTRCVEEPRHGDHRIYISDTTKFRTDYPAWGISRSLEDICVDLIERFERDETAVLQG
jgi:CDP-paratose 2-epimerase